MNQTLRSLGASEAGIHNGSGRSEQDPTGTPGTPVTSSSAGISKDFLSLLCCPYCGFALDLTPADNTLGAINYGILRCACYEYPIVEGIPILQQLDGLGRVVQLIRERQWRQALLRSLDMFRVQWALSSRFHRLKYYWNCSRLASRPDATFQEAALLVRRPRVLADYLIHRYANPSFLAAIGPMMLLENVAKPHPTDARFVLDLACGAGHASFLMRLLFPELSVVSADSDFVNLYLARRYMSPGGLQLCIDAQVPNPFPDQYFDAVYCQDAFHYVPSKKSAVQELKRVSKPDALWIFPHLHNRLCQNVVAGVPLSPEEYFKCFDLADARIFAERDLLRGLVHEQAVDFSVPVPAAKLSESPDLTFIRGGVGVWRAYRDFPKAFCRRKDHLRINPIYRCQHWQSGYSLQLHWPNPVIQRECAYAETVLPKSCQVSEQQLARLNSESTSLDEESCTNLVARFVLVPLPHNYSSKQ